MRAKSEEVRLGRWKPKQGIYVNLILAGMQIFFQSRAPYWDQANYPIECFHMTSRRPYWCPKTIKRRPCWCPKPVLWELNSFLMQTLSFVLIYLHRCWPREWKHSIALMGTTLLIRIFILQVVHSAVKNMATVSKEIIIKGMKKYSRCKARQEKTGEGGVNFYLRQLRRRVLTFWTTSVLLIAG